MSVGGELPRLAKAAAAAAESLAKATTPTNKTRALTLGDHATGLQKLYQALASLTSPVGVLTGIAGTCQMRWEMREYRADPGQPAPRDHVAALSALSDTAHSALSIVRSVDLEPVFRRVDADCRRLSETNLDHAWPSGRPNVLAIRSRDAGASFVELGEDIWAPTGLLEDAVVALDAATTIVAALSVTCGHEGTLLTAAYQSGKIPRAAANPVQTLTAASETLASANSPLATGTAEARRLAKADAKLPALTY